MKLKFINCLLAVALLAGSAQTLTSCKDYDEDQFSQLEATTMTLQQKHDQDIAMLNGLIQTLNGEINRLDGELANLTAKLNDYVTKAEFNAFLTEYTQLKADHDRLVALVNSLQTKIAELDDKKADKADLAALAERVTHLEECCVEAMAAISNLNNKYDRLFQFIADNEGQIAAIPYIYYMAEDAQAKADQNAADIAALQAAIDALKSCECDPTVLQQQIDAIVAQLNNYYNKTEVDALIEALRASIPTDYATPAQVQAAIDAAIADLVSNTDLANALNNYATKEELTTAVDNLTAALAAQAETLREEAAQNLYEAKVYTNTVVAVAVSQITGGSTLTIKDLANMIDAVQKQMQDQLDALKEDVVSNTARITAIEGALNSITNRLTILENRISSIELQGTLNPITGYFNTPFGVNSNLLLGFAGEQDYEGVNFPSSSHINYYSQMNPGVGADLARIANISGKNGWLIDGQNGFEYGKTLVWGNLNEEVEDVPMGKVYVTLNPANIDLTGKTFSLVNSQGTKSAVDLNVAPTNDLLYFGFSRSAANGFYEGVATVPYSKRNQVKLALKPDFKDVVLDIIKNPKSTDLTTVAQLAKATYNQFSDIAPALGFQAAWNEDGKNQVVTSKYGVGAVMFEPLSYRFLYGEGVDKELPLIPGSIGVDFTVSEPTVSITEHYACPPFFDRTLTISMTVYPEYLHVVVKNFPVIGPDGTSIGTEPESNMTLDVANVNLLLDAVMAKVKQTINTKVPAAYRAEILNHAETELRPSLDAAIYNDKAAIQVAQSFAQVLDDVRDQVMDQVNRINDKLNGRLADSVNKLIKRVNKALKDPNHYLQPTMFIDNGSSLVHLSNTKSYPTTVVGKGGVTLVPTTFTAEVLSPAWAKYVAVSNVYNADMTKNADNDANCKALMKAANNQPNMNCPFDGNIHRVPFEVNSHASGYTYEIIYSALDFRGCASTQKFYVTIK